MEVGWGGGWKKAPFLSVPTIALGSRPVYSSPQNIVAVSIWSPPIYSTHTNIEPVRAQKKRVAIDVKGFVNTPLSNLKLYLGKL